MSKKVTVPAPDELGGATEYFVHCNNIPRPLWAAWELPDGILESEFDYLDDEEGYTPRFVQYLGSWFDVYEFVRAGHDIKALGFDAFQSGSFWSATVVRFTDDYESVVIGRIHW